MRIHLKFKHLGFEISEISLNIDNNCSFMLSMGPTIMRAFEVTRLIKWKKELTFHGHLHPEERQNQLKD